MINFLGDLGGRKSRCQRQFTDSQMYSQSNQERIVEEFVFRALCGGTFIELGAADGIAHSNTWFFEQVFARKRVLEREEIW